MTKIIYLSFIALLLISCTQNEVDFSDGYVYDGRGGINCKVDGIRLKPSDAFLYGNAQLDSDSDDVGPFLSSSFHNNNQSTGLGFQAIRILVRDANAFGDNMTGNTYPLLNETLNEGYGNYILQDFENPFETNSTIVGELHILYHDPTEGIVAGTFWFDAINDEGVVKQIRDGQFDMWGG